MRVYLVMMAILLTSTIKMQEARHDIFRDCLGFKAFSYFDGVRFAYEGIRIKLKVPFTKQKINENSVSKIWQNVKHRDTCV